MHRLIPQWLIAFLCGRGGHDQTIERQVQERGTALLVRSCRCGANQSARVYRVQFPLRAS